jgi:four helix bundle protein
MNKQDWTPQEKPFDIRERTFLFACLIVRLVEFLHTRGPVACELSSQLLRCGTSVSANVEEADDGSSKADKRAKRRIALREIKETKLRLRMPRARGYLTEAHDPVLVEMTRFAAFLRTW